MKVVFLGGTGFVGPPTVRRMAAAGHCVVVAHTGAHEVDDLPAEHLHASREELLAPDGPVDAARPDVLVDPFTGGASVAKADELAATAGRTGARIVAISSCDVYQALVDAGLGDGSERTLLPTTPIPIPEDAPRRTRPYPNARPGHDNAAMERALEAHAPQINAAILRPGAIYGPRDGTAREWPLIRRALAGHKHLLLPDRGVQVFHRVAVGRVSRAIAAAAERAPAGVWHCNVVDPYDWTYAGLAAEIGRLLDHEWEPEAVGFDDAGHPYRLSTPILMSDRRLRDVLEVVEPDPREALAETVAWFREHGVAEDALYKDY